MAKRGSEDLKKLSVLQASLVRIQLLPILSQCSFFSPYFAASSEDSPPEDIPRPPALTRRFPARTTSQRRASTNRRPRS